MSVEAYEKWDKLVDDDISLAGMSVVADAEELNRLVSLLSSVDMVVETDPKE